MSLPFDAELMPAKERRFKETVVLVHHFGGSRRTVLRHVRMLNDLGFDCVRFDLIFHKDRPQARLPITADPITNDLKFGVRHVWADQISSLLNSITGPKILYTFSMPSGSALEATSARTGGDVTAIVCDCGPFLQMARCIWNLYEQEYKVKSRVLRASFTAASLLIWGLKYERQAREFMAKMPEGLPVLSIRGWQDTLVPVSAIDEFFNLPNKLEVETLALAEAGHLNGLRDFPNEYVPRVESFLKRHSHAATADKTLNL